MSEPQMPTGEQPGANQPSTGKANSSSSLARSSALMASGTLVSRILGLVRVALLAGAIGPLTQAANAWDNANTLPNTIYLLLAGGVLNVVFVPQLTRALARKDKGRDLTDRLITLALTAMFAITVVATAGGWVLTKLYAWSWSGDQLALAVALAYLCLPQILFYGIYALLGQILNAQEKFGWYMWAPVASNIVAIAGLIVFAFIYPDAGDIALSDWTPSMIWLLAGTATLGIVVQAAVLFEPVRRSGFRYRPRWGFRGVGLRAASQMAIWTLAIIAISQAGLLLSSNVLNEATDGINGVPGKAAYGYAFLLFILPHSLIATSLLTAMLPSLSRAAAADDRPLLAEQYRRGLRLLATAMVPIAVGMIILAPQITALLFILTGPQATNAIASILMILTVGLVPYGIYLLSQRVFHAYQEGRPPFQLQVVITTVSVVAIIGAFFLPNNLTAMGIAAGQSGGQIVAAILAVIWVRRRIDSPDMSDVRRTYLGAFAASLIAAAPTLGIQLWLNSLLDGKLAAFITLGVCALVFFGLYGLLAHRFGVRELSDVLTPLTRRLRRGKPSTQSSTPKSPVPASDSPTPTPDRQDKKASPLVLDWSDSERELSKEPMVHGIDTGTVLGGRYALEELLARRDDTLDYWSAHDQTLDRLVAVTALPATGAHEEMAHAVLDGARRTAGVDDPRLVRVLDVGLSDGVCWIVEEGLSDAESLASLVADQPLAAEEARRIVGEAASGMESARRRGLHHLYLNPHAVLRTSEGSIKISGVGVAAAIEQTDEISATEASGIDTTDLLSLLYTALTGRWPGEDIEALRPARRRSDGSLPAPSEVVGGVPGDLDALCRSTFSMLDPDPAGPTTPGELAKILAPWSSEVVTAASVFSLDAPLNDDDGVGAYAALAAGAGASAAVSAARSGDARGQGGDEQTDEAEPDYHLPKAGAVAMGAGAASASDVSLSATEASADTTDDDDDSRAARGVGAAAVAGSAAAGSAVAGGTSAGGASGSGSSGGGASGGGAIGGSTADDSSSDDAATFAGKQPFQSGIVLAIIALVVVVALFLGYDSIKGLFSDDGTGDSPAASTATSTGDSAIASDPDPDEPEATSAPEDEAEETATPTEEPLEPIEPQSITSYDPQGDGNEKNDLAPLAIDGDSTTSWRSRTYLSPDWGNLKDGVGLAIDLGESQEVSEVDISFPQGDYGVEVYVGDEATLDATEIGSEDEASGDITVTADEAVEGRYLLVWFTRAWPGPNGEIVYVSEVAVR